MAEAYGYMKLRISKNQNELTGRLIRNIFLMKKPNF